MNEPIAVSLTCFVFGLFAGRLWQIHRHNRHMKQHGDFLLVLWSGIQSETFRDSSLRGLKNIADIMAGKAEQ